MRSLSAICHCKCRCSSIGKHNCICIDKTVASTLDNGQDSVTSSTGVTFVTFVTLVSVFAVFAIFTGRTVDTVFSVRTDKRKQPFLNCSLESILNGKIVNRLSVKSVLSILAVFTVFTGSAVNTVFSVSSVLTGRADKREQPFLNCSRISILHSKLIRALSVRAVSSL